MQFRSFMASALVALSLTALGQGKKESIYRYTVDLTKVVNDKVYVELSPTWKFNALPINEMVKLR